MTRICPCEEECAASHNGVTVALSIYLRNEINLARALVFVSPLFLMMSSSCILYSIGSVNTSRATNAKMQRGLLYKKSLKCSIVSVCNITQNLLLLVATRSCCCASFSARPFGKNRASLRFALSLSPMRALLGAGRSESNEDDVGTIAMVVILVGSFIVATFFIFYRWVPRPHSSSHHANHSPRKSTTAKKKNHRPTSRSLVGLPSPTASPRAPEPTSSLKKIPFHSLYTHPTLLFSLLPPSPHPHTSHAGSTRVRRLPNRKQSNSKTGPPRLMTMAMAAAGMLK